MSSRRVACAAGTRLRFVVVIETVTFGPETRAPAVGWLMETCCAATGCATARTPSIAILIGRNRLCPDIDSDLSEELGDGGLRTAAAGELDSSICAQCDPSEPWRDL